MAKKDKSPKQRARESKRKNRVAKQKQNLERKKLVRNIRKWDDPILKVECEPLQKDDDWSFIEVMKKTLAATKQGVGLAAPQIGETKKVVVLQPNGSDSQRVMINPIIADVSEETVSFEEGCLSYPGIFISIERYTWVNVRYKDETFDNVTKVFRDYESAIAQHEIDHLRGCGGFLDKVREKYNSDEGLTQHNK